MGSDEIHSLFGSSLELESLSNRRSVCRAEMTRPLIDSLGMLCFLVFILIKHQHRRDEARTPQSLLNGGASCVLGIVKLDRHPSARFEDAINLFPTVVIMFA